jgi:hypothetical protein
MDFSDKVPKSETSLSVISSYYSVIALMAFFGFIQGIVLGLYEHHSFSAGYISGIIILVLILGSALWNVMPSVVIGLIVAVISVILGIVIKIVITNRTYNNDEEYYW